MLILNRRMLFSKIKELPCSFRFSYDHHFGFRFDFLHQQLFEILFEVPLLSKTNQQDQYGSSCLLFISLEFTSCDKRFSTNYLLALDAFVLVRRSSIASESAQFFRSHINFLALNLTSHGILNYFWSADLLKRFSQLIVSIFIFLIQ